MVSGSAIPVTFETPFGDTAFTGRVVGIDLGGTKILGGISDLGGAILATREEPTLHGEDAPVLDQIARLIRNLVVDAGATEEDILSVVIGVPSAVDPATGLATLSPNLALPSDQSVAELMVTRVSCPVYVENDVNLAAFAEANTGIGKGVKSLAFVSFGTGVGMGLVINGEIWRGEFGRAGEIGYLAVGSKPHETAPGSENGLYEDAVGSRGIRRRFTSNGDTVADLFVAARKGDAGANEALDEISRSASIGIAAVHALFDPAVTVIGGGIGTQSEFFQLVRKHLGPLLPFDCRLEQSHFGSQAGLIGATLMAARHARNQPGALRVNAS